MFKPENKVFEERREIFLNKLGGKAAIIPGANLVKHHACLLYTSPSPRDRVQSRMPSSA